MTRTCHVPSSQTCQWIKGKVIGSGSYGTVNLALDKVSGALYVSKSAHCGSAAQFLENEADILASLSSPHIVRYVGKEVLKELNGESKLNVFLEYMAGGSLSDMVKSFGGVLDEEVISLYTRQILYGLKHLQENGIVHCDLKCKNVLLGSSGNVKLADFGCAKRVEDTKNDGKLACSWQTYVGGTPLWMAPEVLRNEELGFASDIWSLGCTVIELATGRPPWSDKVSNPAAAVLKIACSDETPKFPLHFSDEGLDFLAKCLERNPRRRWTSLELLDHPFVSRNTQNQGVSSPSSVLDIGIYDGVYGSDESQRFKESETLHRNPISTDKLEKPQGEVDFITSDTWVTVR